MYRLNEGQIDFPKEWKDQSINIISSTGGGAAGLSFTVTRDDLPWGMEFPEYVKDQIAQAEESLNDFKNIGQIELEVSKSPAVEIECSWSSKQGVMHQIITTVSTPPRALVLTASMPGRMSDAQKTEVRRIVASFRLNDKDT
ncbi:DcrB-related protein [Marivita sp. S0852]|uniref:DcrB-related protein n=1 Tax=Marivita sp. S0852 TaxID=3373893 RepID=UPI00398237EA